MNDADVGAKAITPLSVGHIKSVRTSKKDITVESGSMSTGNEVLVRSEHKAGPEMAGFSNHILPQSCIVYAIVKYITIIYYMVIMMTTITVLLQSTKYH